MYYDIIIIGGGASGLCLASQVKTDNTKVLIIDHSDRVGKKLLSTGNGKCNLTNMYACTSEFQSNPENIYPYFTSGNNDFIETVINAFDCHDSVKMFNRLGILTENKNSYIYPRSEQASAVLDMFRNNAEELGVDIVTNLQPLKISQRSGYFYVDNYKCEKLVLACGGMSAPGTGSDGTGYEIAKSFGHNIIKPRPVLCGLHCSDKFFKTIQGVRNDCRVNLINNNSIICSVQGNVQFNGYGISGIPVFQISSEAGALIESRQNITVELDLLPEYSEKEITDFLKNNPDGNILNKKLFEAVRKTAGSYDVKAIVHTVKHFTVHPFELCPFTEAQATAGGIDTSEIDPETMESKLIKGLYFTGEIMDVNGICGGYNLQWCWSTANIAARALKSF